MHLAHLTRQLNHVPHGADSGFTFKFLQAFTYILTSGVNPVWTFNYKRLIVIVL